MNKQSNNAARASRFFVHFFAITARLRQENAKFHVLWHGGRKQETAKLSSSSWTWLRIWFLGIRLKKTSLAIDKVNELE